MDASTHHPIEKGLSLDRLLSVAIAADQREIAEREPSRPRSKRADPGNEPFADTDTGGICADRRRARDMGTIKAHRAKPAPRQRSAAPSPRPSGSRSTSCSPVPADRPKRDREARHKGPEQLIDDIGSPSSRSRLQVARAVSRSSLVKARAWGVSSAFFVAARMFIVAAGSQGSGVTLEGSRPSPGSGLPLGLPPPFSAAPSPRVVADVDLVVVVVAQSLDHGLVGVRVWWARGRQLVLQVRQLRRLQVEPCSATAANTRSQSRDNT